jgi:hypothetical protein
VGIAEEAEERGEVVRGWIVPCPAPPGLFPVLPPLRLVLAELPSTPALVVP